MKDHAEFETVGTLKDTESLEDGIILFRPHVVVLDLAMPGRDSIEALTSARRQFPTLGFLVFSSVDDPQKVEAAMAAGATGYLVKEGDYDELASGLRKVANGERVQPRIGYRYGPTWVD